MMRFRGVAALLLAIISILGFVAPAKAANSASQLVESGTAHGLIVKYRAGVDPVAADGQATAANAAKRLPKFTTTTSQTALSLLTSRQ